MNKSSILSYKQNIYLSALKKSKTWGKEHRIPGGKIAREKDVMVIRRSGMKLGLFSYVITMLGRIYEAEQRGMIPVIDMQNFMNAYLENDNYGTVNSWELYFEQPGKMSLEDAYKSKRIFISDAGIPVICPSDRHDFLNGDDGELDKWKKLYEEYIIIKPEILQDIEERWNRLIDDNSAVLGVLARGTDYLKLEPQGHPVQPTIEELIDKVDETLSEYDCNRIFLATEDKLIYDKLSKRYGDILISGTKYFLNYKDGYLSEVETSLIDGKYRRGLDYLSNIVMLSKCKCFVGGRTSGTVGAALMNNSWVYAYFFDIGTY